MGTERPNIFNEPGRDAHRMKRKIVGPAISERAMRFFEAELRKEIDVVLRQLLKLSQNGEVVDMTPRCKRLGVDVVGRLAFEFELKSQLEPTHRHVAAGIRARSRLSSVYMSWPDLRILDPLVHSILPRRHKA